MRPEEMIVHEVSTEKQNLEQATIDTLQEKKTSRVKLHWSD